MRCCKRESSTEVSVLKSTDGQRRQTAAPPPFDSVIKGEYKHEPWSASTFLDFMIAERNEENFYFFEEIEALKAIKGKAPKPPSEDLLILPGEVRANPETHVKEIVKTFVETNAPKEVNISDEQRKNILRRFSDIESQSTSSVADPELFDEAQGEIKRLMMQDSWPRFLKKMITENINAVDAYSRLRGALFEGIITLLGVGLILGLKASRFYLFLLIPPTFLMWEDIVTYKMKFCVVMAAQKARGRLTGGKSDRAAIACPFVKKQHRHRVYIALVYTAIATVMTIGFFFALSFIIEAIAQQSFY